MSYHPFALIVKSQKGNLVVRWNDAISLAKYANIQSGFYLSEKQSFNVELLEQKFTAWNQMFWDQRERQGMFDYPDNARVLDIGSGISVIDLLLYSYIPNSTFYLLDNEGWDDKFSELGIPNISYGENYPIYNSWAPVTDAIESSGFDKNRFRFLDTNSTFPEDLDVITSYLSWCFHYPKEIYWNQVQESLKVGGKLILDVRPIHDRDIIGEISEAMRSKPTTFTFPKVSNYVDDYNGPDPSVTGYRCMWTKN